MVRQPTTLRVWFRGKAPGRPVVRGPLRQSTGGGASMRQPTTLREAGRQGGRSHPTVCMGAAAPWSTADPTTPLWFRGSCPSPSRNWGVCLRWLKIPRLSVSTGGGLLFPLFFSFFILPRSNVSRDIRSKLQASCTSRGNRSRVLRIHEEQINKKSRKRNPIVYHLPSTGPMSSALPCGHGRLSNTARPCGCIAAKGLR